MVDCLRVVSQLYKHDCSLGNHIRNPVWNRGIRKKKEIKRRGKAKIRHRERSKRLGPSNSSQSMYPGNAHRSAPFIAQGIFTHLTSVCEPFTMVDIREQLVINIETSKPGTMGPGNGRFDPNW